MTTIDMGVSVIETEGLRDDRTAEITAGLVGDHTYDRMLTPGWAVSRKPFAMFFVNERHNGQTPDAQFPDESWFHVSQLHPEMDNTQRHSMSERVGSKRCVDGPVRPLSGSDHEGHTVRLRIMRSSTPGTRC